MQAATTRDELHGLMRGATDSSLLYVTADENAAFPEALPGWRTQGERYRDGRYGGMFAMLYVNDARARLGHQRLEATRPQVQAVRRWGWTPWGQPIAYTTYVID